MVKWILIVLPLLICGCKTVNTVPTGPRKGNPVVEMRYDEETKTFYEDQWDYFIRGVKNGTVVFTWPKAIVCYLISNVKIVVFHPEESGDVIDKLGMQIIIFRWSW